ncbi:hypothetical protein M5W68_00005 [Paenibacillus larvae]|nr:hypothetical protein [Paenibacillus larvae]MCY9512511.1 hypothetical protein [Paenibacillus larvae]MCY9523590.1 hypothetical protein [Paenibacillus larvae]
MNQGVDAKIISERLGHGSVTTTMNIYANVLRTQIRQLLINSNSFFI